MKLLALIITTGILFPLYAKTTSPLPPSFLQRPTHQNTAYNGSTFIATTNKSNPKPLQIDKKTYQWIPHPKNPHQKISLIGINYHKKPQTIQIGEGITLQILKGNYKQEQIQVESGKAKPNPKNAKRIAKEAKEAAEIYAKYTPQRYWNSPFILPMKSKITSPYGTARTFNGEVKSYHSGTDFRAPIGKKIFASNDGIVVIARDRFLSGKGIVISHGEGIFSMYYHCSELKVKEGQIVKKGELVALSGNSGRVSGPHLHFGFLVNGASVDPMDFLEAVNALF
ncbi:peptidase M24 [Helicobacter monodelphidis]|uniref:M23 family metallopeptidase n=1 Tax=Helicobacter sp. 15-1451 TaxID=2004995 RepID=UPI000DCE94D8|nr:M23 family metallopeptidase [Helicobacter sp. 15-1451]RAX57404.1 peptidase M24 [Helicobacter sp. 15-1451]